MDILLQSLPVSIKYMIHSYCGGTPSAEAIKTEIKRILPIIESDRLGEDQTIWSIMTIYWFEYYENSDKQYQQLETPLAIDYELRIAKGIHLCMSFNNSSYECIPNYFNECLQKDFVTRYNNNIWWEKYLIHINPLSVMDV